MSPEQAKGAPVDRRSDIFSLGIVLWEMVTTSRLFRGENDLATLQLIINVPPKRPSEARPDCPPDLERIILKALSQDITQRYQSADELLRDLEKFQSEADIGPSATALSVYVSELFAPEINSWNEAKAAGVPLGEHLTHIGDMTEPVLESEFIEAMDLPAMLAREEALEAMDDEDDELDDDDDEDHPTMIPVTPDPAKVEASRPMAKPRAQTPPIPTRAPTMPPPKPPVLPPRRDATPTPRTASAANEATDVMTTQRPPISQTLTAVGLADAPTNLLAPTIEESMPPAPRPPPSSNPWPVIKTPTKNEAPNPAASMSGSMRAGNSLSRMRAWASGSFPAHKIDPEVRRMWERRALLVGGIVLGLIFALAVIAAITN
jgi:hypothetical protein